MAVATYAVGTLVRHPRKTEWGPGKVLAVNGNHVTIYFRDAPGSREAAVKKIDVARMPLEIADQQSDPWLDNLIPDGRRPKFRMSFGEALQGFQRLFPLGFADPAYESNERDYKWNAHQLFEELFGASDPRTELESGEVEELTRKTLRVVSKVNLLSMFENAALRDGMKDRAAAQRYLEALFDVLAEPAPSRDTFEALVSAVQRFPAESGKSNPNKWTVVTILPFLARPDMYPFLKPEATKNAAEALSFDLNYDASPNWRTYQKLLDLGQVLRDELVKHGLEPRDWIDLQSFMWITAGEYWIEE